MATLSKVRIRPRTPLVVLTLTLAFLFLVLASATVSGWAFAFAGLFGSFGAWTIAGGRWRADGELVLEKHGVVVVRAPGLKKTFARKVLEDGYGVPPRGLVLHFRDGPTLEATFADASSAMDVLNHLGLDVAQRALSVPLRGMLGGFVRGLLAFMVTWFSSLFVTAWLGPIGILVSLFLATIVTALVVRRLRPHVIVGVDGVRIAGVLNPRFIPYSAIAKVYVATIGQNGESGIALEGAFGRRVLPTIGQSTERAQALVRRIEAGRRGDLKEGARELGVLDRGGRSITSWKAAVRSVTAGSFRDAALDMDDLEQVLADHHAPLERRIGAALALREVESGRERIRVAASTSADPRVRVALERAGDAELDEEELLRAIDAQVR